MKKKKSHKRTESLLSPNKVLRIFAENPDKSLGISALKRRLNLQKLGPMVEILETMERKKLISKTSPGKWTYIGLAITPKKGKEEIYEGTLDMARAGFGYVLCKGLARDIYVAPKNMMSAQDGDFVQVKIVRMYMNKPEGVILKILQRSKSQFVGVYRAHKNQAVVLVESHHHVMEVFLPKEEADKLVDFDRVIIDITKWKEKPGDRMWAKVVKNLGQESSIEVEMQSILAESGFPLEFPKAALDEANQISDKISPADYRKDLRDKICFTIDPVDAKDFDDAISIHRDELGSLEIGVHIADVSHYVLPDSALDKEALRRGNSVYLVDRVLPMLPERLSNHLCSLRPNEDKYTFSVIFTFDEEYTIKKHWIGKTIIHSKQRFAYEDVQKILEGESHELEDHLHLINRITKMIRKERMKNGSIDFESPEVRFKLDDQGIPLELYVKERFDAHMLIEELMLLANQYVAKFISLKNKTFPIPFVYRIHDLPDPMKLEEFQFFAQEMGVKLDLSNPKKISKSLNILSEKVKEDDSLKILLPLAIRTMAKAEYNPENIGHYGLGFEFYTHFTSPIRRYADLMVHRILFDNLTNEKRYRPEMIEAQCRYISSQERKAMEAERESVRYFQALYMQAHVGEIFEGRITGMNDRGFFVQLIDTMCEGSLAMDTFDDNIAVNKNRLSANSTLSDQSWKMGDKIKVKLISSDPEDRAIVFEPVIE
ncbi:MAG: ribonuclease R [Saprospiraceae bacterium]|nr:ribonuclease R [Saprospiraceae bacterium]MBK9632304.1 ribonuclease R [Saprospiraceae bacterium]